jgi:hypothetical protein
MLVGGEGEGSEELGGKKGSTRYTTPRFSMTVDSLILDLKETSMLDAVSIVH